MADVTPAAGTGAVPDAARRREEAREREFWDAYPDTVSVGVVNPDRLDACTQARLDLLGEVRGRHILDLGCGVGYSTTLFALRGARVEAVDISPRCVEMTATQARQAGVSDRVNTHVMSAYALGFPDESFDLVHGQDILHHLEIDLAGREIKRVLRAGGRAVFQENNANNPVLMFARRFCGHFGIPKWSSGDEHPLTRNEVRQLGRVLGGELFVDYPIFECFVLFDYKIFRARFRPISVLCRRLDELVFEYLPVLRPFSWKQIVVVRKGA